ncbi:hypothetical protein [Nocardia australiensis]|uniref:hypothetical protein n=1 Tax=Nocardia australiensis TaxID=2887191 RepID=UPI001D1491BE|nr:hypothetical protein [Nocardia australiensis]
MRFQKKMTASSADRVVSMVDSLLEISGKFTIPTLGKICRVEFIEIDTDNSSMREFEGHSSVFSEVSVRFPKDDRVGAVSILAITLRTDIPIMQADIEAIHPLIGSAVHINPRMPPEGTITYHEAHGRRVVIYEFTAFSRQLCEIAVHDYAEIVH